MTKILILLTILLSTLFTNSFAQSKIEKHFYLGEYEKSLELLNEKISSGIAGFTDYQMAAQCEVQQFDFQSAIKNYELALRYDSSNVLIIEGLADARSTLGRKKEAYADYSRIMKLDSANSRVAGKKAGLLMDFDQYAAAEAIYSKLYSLDSSNAYYFRRLMLSKYKQKKYSYVLDLYYAGNKGRIMVSKNNKNADVIIRKSISENSIIDKDVEMMAADSYQKINKNFEAMKILAELLVVDSLYTPAISKLAYINFSAYRNYDIAVEYYRQLNRLEDYQDPFHLKNLGICEYFVGNHEYAANLLDSLTSELSDDPFVLFYAGLSYKKLGDIDKTLDLLERAALFVIPAYTSDLYHHLGRAYVVKRMFEKAIETYKKVREYDPENFQVLYDLAVTYEEFNLNRSAALVYYEQFVKECDNQRSADLKYAENRIKVIKEELFFDGE